MVINKKIWRKVTEVGQLKDGSIIKIIGLSEGDSYRRISVKKVLHMEGANGYKWIEILINKKKNYFFNLTAYLKNEATWGKWVEDLYVRI